MNDCKDYNDQMDLFGKMGDDPYVDLKYDLSADLYSAVCERKLIISNLSRAMGLSEVYIRGVLDNPLPPSFGIVTDICEALDKKLVITLVDK